MSNTVKATEKTRIEKLLAAIFGMRFTAALLSYLAIIGSVISTIIKFACLIPMFQIVSYGFDALEALFDTVKHYFKKLFFKADQESKLGLFHIIANIAVMGLNVLAMGALLGLLPLATPMALAVASVAAAGVMLVRWFKDGLAPWIQAKNRVAALKAKLEANRDPSNLFSTDSVELLQELSQCEEDLRQKRDAFISMSIVTAGMALFAAGMMVVTVGLIATGPFGLSILGLVGVGLIVAGLVGMAVSAIKNKIQKTDSDQEPACEESQEKAPTSSYGLHMAKTFNLESAPSKSANDNQTPSVDHGASRVTSMAELIAADKLSASAAPEPARSSATP